MTEVNAAVERDLESASCPKCHGPNSKPVVTGRDHLHGIAGSFTVAECSTCGFWFLNPRPTPSSIAAFYPDDYGPHAELEVPKRSDVMLTYLARELGYSHLSAATERRGGLRGRIDDARMRWKVGVSLTPHFVANGSLLEIGAASGQRLASLRELGWTDMCGIELVPAAAERARRRGFAIECGPVEGCLDRYPDGAFDVVVSSMVIEHLADPFDVMTRVAKKLRPGGELLFSTITRDALDAKLFGAYWGGLDFPRHLVFFRDRDIHDMVRGSFDVQERFHHFAPQDFRRSASWRAHEGRWLDRVILASETTLPYRALAWAGLTCRVSYRCRKR